MLIYEGSSGVLEETFGKRGLPDVCQVIEQQQKVRNLGSGLADEMPDLGLASAKSQLSKVFECLKQGLF